MHSRQSYHIGMTQQRLTVSAAYQHCFQLAKNHAENFPTASLLLPKHIRPAVAAIYAFARTADDIADEGDLPASERLQQLDAWETLLERSQTQDVEHPIFLALADAMQQFHLDSELLHDLLTAFRMDTRIHSYMQWDDLHYYCKHSANPVGRMMLALYRIHDEEALRASDAICTALQLTNFWQDLSIDLPRGRCYLPSEVWQQHANIHLDDLLHRTLSAQEMMAVMQEAFTHTEALFQQGYALLPKVPFRLRLQLSATISGGMAILKKLRTSPDLLHTRPSLNAWNWISMIPRVIYHALR